MSTLGTRSDFVTRTRQATRKLLESVAELRELKAQWDAGMNVWLVDASGSDPDAEGYEPGDFAGSNAGLMKADITAIITTLAALETLLGQAMRPIWRKYDDRESDTRSATRNSCAENHAVAKYRI